MEGRKVKTEGGVVVFWFKIRGECVALEVEGRVYQKRD